MNTRAFLADTAARRALRIAEMSAALDAGRKILQCGSIWPECSPFAADVGNGYLATHIEAREHGFGFKTEVLSALDVHFRGYVLEGGRWRMGPPRIEAAVEEDIDPSPFYSLRGDGGAS